MHEAATRDADAARYRRAGALVRALLDLPPERRDDALNEACAGDDALRDEARWLLAAAEDGEADTLPPAPILSAYDLHLAAPTPRDYRVLEAIGQGGMGVVYLAERVDGDLRQRVALKLLRFAAPADSHQYRRFATERRILSALAHPNIARLLDGGVTVEGLPFLAMEYVDGERIDAWCDRHALTLRQRVTLFLKVCGAVDYAHRQLVIHRDIKPSNILVGADGEPKLLDFGIARLLDDDVEHTQTDLRALTLAYASPEQIEGAPLGTASDVYSLGMVLYELVAGARPFAVGESAHQLSRAILSGDMPAPSRLVRECAGDALPRARRVPADVDAIVLKALRSEPAHRYASAGALAADLQRWLTARPVHAQRGNWTYRLSRFARRRRWWLTGALVVAALLAAFILDRDAQHARIAVERDRARAVARFMDELFENTDSLHRRGDDVTVRQMLDLGAASLAARGDMAPEQHAALLFATGRAYNALGRSDDATPLLERARAALVDAHAPDEQLAPVELALAAAYSSSRRLAEAVAADERALARYVKLPARHADEIAQARIRALHNHAVMLDRPLADIRRDLDAVLASLEQRDAPVALRIAAWRAMTMAWGGDGVGATAAAERAMSLAQHAYPAGDPRLLSVRYAYVTALQEREPERAAELMPALIDDYERRLGASAMVASLLGNYASLLTRLGRAADALPVFARAADMMRATGGEDGDMYAWAVANMAGAHLALGDAARAEALIRSVLPALVERAQSGGATEAQVFLAAARDTLAEASLARGDTATAEREYAAAADGLATLDPDAYASLHTRALVRLAGVQLRRGQLDAAEVTSARLDRAMNAAHSAPVDSRTEAALLHIDLAVARSEASAREQAQRLRESLCASGESTSMLAQRWPTWHDGASMPLCEVR